MYYEKFEQLLQKTKEKPNQIAKKLGIGSSTMTDWKQGKITPKIDKLQKISDYFGISVSYFFDEQKEKAEPVLKDKFSQMFYSLDDDDRQEIIDIMQLKLSKAKYKKENAG